MTQKIFFLVGTFSICGLLFGCSSSPSNDVRAPDWTKESTRVVDNGYIVYVESDSSTNPDNAKLKAEGLALSDLANECSFIPKGTRIEDRFLSYEPPEPRAFVKLAVEFQECASAQKTVDPDEIRKLASVPFMETLKKYQDFSETGAVAQAEPLDPNTVNDLGAMPPQQGNDEVHFYVVRQYVAYQKEVVILSPPTAFAPQSPETIRYIGNVTPAVDHIQTAQTSMPTLVTKPLTWSKIPNRPTLATPLQFRSRPQTANRISGGAPMAPPPRQVVPMQRPFPRAEFRRPIQKPPPKKKKKK